jgi:hypothetical protein
MIRSADQQTVAAGTSLADTLESFQQELCVYLQQLPSLLAEGEEGRFAVIKGNQISGTWDTYRDASQYGRERFGDEPFMIHRIDSHDSDRLEKLLANRPN